MWGQTKQCGDRRDVHQFFWLSGVKKLGYVPSVPGFVPVRRDIGGMTDALHKLVTPKMVKARNNDDSGDAADLISTAAVIYTRIAWFHGYELRVDSPYIPSEWLPMDPLQRYDDRYGFL